MMDQKEKLLSALALHKVKLESIRGNCVYTQDDFCVEMKDAGLFKLSQGGYVKSTYGDLDKLCAAIHLG